MTTRILEMRCPVVPAGDGSAVPVVAGVAVVVVAGVTPCVDVAAGVEVPQADAPSAQTTATTAAAARRRAGAGPTDAVTSRG